MSTILQVCLYNTDAEASSELRKHIEALNFVRLVAEVSTAEALASTLTESHVNLVFFHLDPSPSAVLELIDDVSARFPELAMIALSHETGPAAILGPIRAGCDQFVCEPIDHSDLAAAVGRVASKRLFSQGKSRCICVTGATGGSGATSIACNLAMEIAHVTDAKCALVDLNLQFGDVALSFDCETNYTFFHLAQAGADLDRAVMESILKELPCNVSLLARPETLDQQENITPDTVHHAIELLTNMFENIVVDMPRRIDACTFAAASQADLVLIICQLLVPNIRNAKRYHDALVYAGIPEERIQLVVNRVDSSGGRITKKDLEELTKKPVYASIPNDYQFVARSLDFGRPVAAQDRTSAVRTAIRKMAQQVTSDATAKPGKEHGRRGFLSRLLAK
ncbi:MAG: CpaE family protein [Phycisphaerae bacterium]